MRPVIFLGGTTEGEQYVRLAHEKLKRFADCVVWNKGVFEVGGNTQQSLVEALRQADFAAFILTADALVEDRGKLLFSPRDNIIFEAGMSFGSIAPDRTFLIPEKVDDLKLPTDLGGFTLTRSFLTSNPSEGLRQAARQIKDVVSEKGVRLSKKKSADKSFLKDQTLQLIRSARDNIFMIGRDLSWYQEYSNDILTAIKRHVRVDVICEYPQNDDWSENVRKLKQIGANVFHTPSDFGLRLTSIDHKEEMLAQFIFASKERHNDRFIYQCEIHDGRSSRVLWMTLTRLYQTVCHT